jgi:hypothetical protein
VTYLELCQFVSLYQQGGNAKPGTNPTTVVGQTDSYNYQVVQNVANAYKSIQNEQDYWTFMQKQGTFALASGGRVLTHAALVAQVADYNNLRPMLVGPGIRMVQLYSDANGVGSETPCVYVPYQEWRGVIDSNTIPTGKPNLFTIQPNRSVEFNLVADQDYSFVCDYQRTLDEWVQVDVGPDLADDQTPIFPSRFHEAIAWRAIWLWAATKGSPEKFQFARDEFNRLMNEMRDEQLPESLPYTSAFDGHYGHFN